MTKPNIRPPRARRISVVNVWTDQNRGDAAIVHATLAVLARRYPEATVDLHNVVFDCDDTKRYSVEHFGSFTSGPWELFPSLFPAVAVREGELRIDHRRRGLYALRAMLLLLLARAHPRLGGALLRRCERPAYESLRQSDFVLSKGGSYLLATEWKQALQLTMVLFPLVLASIFGARTALFGVSVGPARSRIASGVLRFWLRWVDLIVAREQDAYDTCRRLKVPAHKLMVLPDIAFTLAIDESLAPPMPAFLADVDRPRVAVTVRRWSFDDISAGADARQRERAYLEAVSQALVAFQRKTDATILLVPQVIGPGAAGSDLGALDELATRLAGSKFARVPADLPFTALRSVYANVDLLVGTRLHSVILAFGTPTVIIGYQGNKSIGTARLLEMEDSFVHINDITTSNLLAIMSRVWEQRERIRAQSVGKREQFREMFSIGFDRFFDALEQKRVAAAVESERRTNVA